MRINAGCYYIKYIIFLIIMLVAHIVVAQCETGDDEVLKVTHALSVSRDLSPDNIRNRRSGSTFYSPPQCCQNICPVGTFSGAQTPIGWCGTSIPSTYVPIRDGSGSDIWFVGQYGLDPRQKYFVYYPDIPRPDSKIVILIHGGAWFSGPNPTTVSGFPFTFGSGGASIVKDLLQNGYVVVSLLYRLTKYSNDDAVIQHNIDNHLTNTVQTQIDDIQTAITHIKLNFPTCLNLNVNNVQILGESAGAQLALMWAYNYGSSLDYVKSVVSMYAPADINSLATMTRNSTLPCNGGFTTNNLPEDLTFEFNNPLVTYNTEPFDCHVNGHPTTQIIETFKLLECTFGVMVDHTASTISNATFGNFSPSNTNPTIPTFLMHGQADLIVPVSTITNMGANLLSHGGIIGGDIYYYHWNGNKFLNWLGTSPQTTETNIPNIYSSSPIHLIKLYDKANHSWTDELFFDSSTIAIQIRNQVRKDVITWLNGH